MGFGMRMGAGGGMGRGLRLGPRGPASLRHSDLMEVEDDYGRPFDPRVYGRLLRYVRPYRWRIAFSLVMMLLYTGTSVANPYIIGLAIDRAIATRDPAALDLIVLLFVANNLVMMLSQYQQVYQMTWVGQHALFHVASDMFAHLMRLSVSFFDRNEVGRIMARVQNDVTVLQQVLSNGMISIFGSLLTLVGIVVMLFVMNVPLALVAFTAVPVLAGAMAFWQRYARRSFRKVRSKISLVNATLQENVSGIRVIQSLGREEENLRYFTDVNSENRDANLEAGRVSAAIMVVVEMIAAVVTALVIFTGGSMVLSGALTVGALVAFTTYISRFFEPIRELSMQYNNLQRVTVAGERIFEILDTKPEVVDRPDAVELPPVRGEVRFEHVEFWYVEGVPVLHDLTITARPGETVALVGHTGAGKSTVINLLARFYDVRGGRILIDGYDVRDVTAASLRRQIGMVLQEPFLFSGTVRDNIRLGRTDATDAEVEEAARAVGAHDLIMRLEQGYDTPVQERGANLSLGQRQLISFARALIADPRILILDEATASLDTATELVVQEGLKRLLAGRTAFIIAHRLATIRDADQIIVLRQGRVVERGRHQELLALQGEYYKLYAMGFQQAGRDGAATSPTPTPAVPRGRAAGGRRGAG
ncbi:MAG TPA: ABC transporter ATP-binding protein [Dehalococcoidia bacterium]